MSQLVQFTFHTSAATKAARPSLTCSSLNLHSTALNTPDKSDLLWDPIVEDQYTEQDVNAYLDFACSSSVQGGASRRGLGLG